MSDPIDFEAAKERRVVAEIDADQEHWEKVRDQLVQVLATSELSDIALTSASLRALLDVLEHGGLNRRDAKERVVKTLRGFREDDDD